MTRKMGAAIPLITALLLASCNTATPGEPPSPSSPPPTATATPRAERVASRPTVPPRSATAVPPTSSVPTATPTRIPTLASLPRGVLHTNESTPSPNGKWIVRHLQHDAQTDVPTDYGTHPYLYHSQSLLAADNSVTHTIRADWIPDGLGATWPQFLGWASDSSAAFVYMGGSPDGCALSGWSEEVWRVSVPDGEVTVLGAVPRSPSLSADSRWLGGIGNVDETTAEFAWIAAASGERGRSTFPIPRAEDGTAGEVVAPYWSPDGSAIVARVAYGACTEDWREVLVYHELGTAEAHAILERTASSGYLWIDDWLPDDTLVITDRPPWWGESGVAPKVLRIDARTGEKR